MCQTQIGKLVRWGTCPVGTCPGGSCLITIIFLLNPSLRRHAQSTAQMPKPLKFFSPNARVKVDECRAKVWRRVTKTQRPWRERKMRNLAGSCFALWNLAFFPNFNTLSTMTKQSFAAQIHTRRDYKICRKDFFWCNRPMALPWRRVPELRMCESKMTRRNVPDPNWETQVLRKVMWEIMKVKTVLSTLLDGFIFGKRNGPMDRWL